VHQKAAILRLAHPIHRKISKPSELWKWYIYICINRHIFIYTVYRYIMIYIYIYHPNLFQGFKSKITNGLSLFSSLSSFSLLPGAFPAPDKNPSFFHFKRCWKSQTSLKHFETVNQSVLHLQYKWLDQILRQSKKKAAPSTTYGSTKWLTACNMNLLKIHAPNTNSMNGSRHPKLVWEIPSLFAKTFPVCIKNQSRFIPPRYGETHRS
jgi:hypothetical protein